MAFANVSWEISTGDPVRALSAGEALRKAIEPFRPCWLLNDTVLFDTDQVSLDLVLRAVDAVCLQYLTELYYTCAEFPDGSGYMQGVYPQMAELSRARQISGSPTSPFERLKPVPVARVTGSNQLAARRSSRGRARARRKK